MIKFLRQPIFLLISSTITISCSDFLEVKSLNEIVLEQFWNEENDVESIVAGIYSTMQSQEVISRMMIWGEFRSDNIIAGLNTENDNDLVNLLKENITSNNTYCKWGEFYNIINTCNTVIYYAPQVAEKDPNYTQSELNATIAEVSTLRDLCYFYLIRAFKDVPYYTYPFLDDSQTMDLPVSSFDNILDSLILDLESVRSSAVTIYPITNTYAQTGRITKNAIDALLCELYLWKGDYAKSVLYADYVIDAMTKDYEEEKEKKGNNNTMNDLIDGFPLISSQSYNGSDYGAAYNSIFGTGNSSETIFELVYMDDDTYLANSSLSSFYGNSSSFPGLVKPSDYVAGDVDAETFNIFKDMYDSRYWENIQVLTSTYGIQKYVSNKVSITVSASKVTTNASELYSSSYCHANWILYRLSDIMLLKAEAMCQQMNDADALTANDSVLISEVLAIVNALEKRSCMSSYTNYELSSFTSRSLLSSLVLLERQKELMFEGKRWFDLLRNALREGNTSSLATAVARKGSDNASVTQSKLARMEALFWPYHSDELDVNANLVQNPAYATAGN